MFNLQPRTFTFKDGGVEDVGFIAEEVAEAHHLFARWQDDDPANINWNAITACLVKELKKLKKEVENLKKKKIKIN